MARCQLLPTTKDDTADNPSLLFSHEQHWVVRAGVAQDPRSFLVNADGEFLRLGDEKAQRFLHRSATSTWRARIAGSHRIGPQVQPDGQVPPGPHATGSAP